MALIMEKCDSQASKSRTTTNVSEVTEGMQIIDRNERWIACIQVLGSFFLFFNTWGISNSYGAFQTYYENDLMSYESASNVSWVGSIQAFIHLFGGLFAGPLYDASYARPLMAFGSFMMVLGLMMTSLCKTYAEFILAQGLTVGIGMGCLMMPALAILFQYFPNRLALPIGIATSGGSIGGIIYPTVFRQLRPQIGFPWTTRVMAFLALATLLIPLSVMKPKPHADAEGRPRVLFDKKAFKNVPYALFTVSAFFAFMGLYIPHYYIQIYAGKIGMDPQLSSYLLIIMNAVSTFGRIVPTFFADKFGPINITLPFTCVCSLLAFSWMAVNNTTGLIVFCIFYGFFAGTYVSILGPTIMSLSKESNLKGTRLGMTFAAGALGMLVGTPVAGQFLGSVGWIGVQAWCGSTSMIAAAFILAARLAPRPTAVDGSEGEVAGDAEKSEEESADGAA